MTFSQNLNREIAEYELKLADSKSLRENLKLTIRFLAKIQAEMSVKSFSIVADELQRLDERITHLEEKQ